MVCNELPGTDRRTPQENASHILGNCKNGCSNELCRRCLEHNFKVKIRKLGLTYTVSIRICIFNTCHGTIKLGQSIRSRWPRGLCRSSVDLCVISVHFVTKDTMECPSFDNAPKDKGSMAISLRSVQRSHGAQWRAVSIL